MIASCIPHSGTKARRTPGYGACNGLTMFQSRIQREPYEHRFMLSLFIRGRLYGLVHASRGRCIAGYREVFLPETQVRWLKGVIVSRCRGCRPAPSQSSSVGILTLPWTVDRVDILRQRYWHFRTGSVPPMRHFFACTGRYRWWAIRRRSNSGAGSVNQGRQFVRQCRTNIFVLLIKGTIQFQSGG